MAWPISKLSELCRIVSGSTPRTGQKEYWDGEIAWITPKDLSNQTSMYITQTTQRITKAGYASCSTELLPVKSVLLSSRAPIGYVAINTIPMCTNQGFKSFIPDSTRLHSEYLYFWLRANRDYLQSLGNGATFKEISKATVERIEIPLPPLAEQKRIAAILDEADALRRKRREALAKLDTLLQSVFLDMFGDPVTNPKGWEVRKLGDLLERPAQNGAYYPQEQYSTKSNEGVEMVHMGDAFSGVVERGGLKRVYISEKDTQKYALNQNDLLIVRRSLVYEGSAKPCLIPKVEKEPLIYESSLIRVTPKNLVMTPLYLFYFLSNQRAKARYVLPFVTRSTISGINQSNLVSISLPLPPFRLQEEFASRVTAINTMREQQQASLNHLERLFTSLQQQAFSSAPTDTNTTETPIPPCLTFNF